MRLTRVYWKPYLLALLALILSACQGPLPTAQPPILRPGQDDAAAMLISEKARQTQPQVDPQDLEQLSAGNRAFALDLYRQLAGSSQENLFFSPYSISMALAMTEAGARRQTLTEMDQALHFSLPQDRLHRAFNAIDQGLNTQGTQVQPELKAEGFQLNIVNSLWGQMGYPFRAEYLDVLAQNYGAGLRLADFSADPEAARLAINDWVLAGTAGKIKDLLPPSAVNTQTRLVLANAIYFKASWLDPFEESNTRSQPFTHLDGSQSDQPAMHQTQHYAYAQGEGWQAVELRYASPDFGLVVLLPEAGAFPEFEAGLDAAQLDSILAALQYQEVELTLPRFEFESGFALEDALVALGMREPFDPDRADFSGMADTNELYIGAVIHKAFVSLDENGTEAAAATAVSMAAGAAAPEVPVVMQVDRPFIFLIREQSTGTILFLGRVTGF